jgi:hypothetical protein
MQTKWILIGAVAITLALASGCSTTHEIGKSSAQLFRGEQGTTVDQPSDRVGPAIEQAIADLKLIRINATTRPSEQKTETVVVARNSQDVRIQIAYVPVNANSTRVVVSTGAFGDSDLRDKVYDAVRIRLGVLNITPGTTASTPPAPAPTAPAAPSTQPLIAPNAAAIGY